MSVARIEQQPCFILHARAYRETSLLLECLSRDSGRIGIIARGVRRERTRVPRALLQPFTPVNMSWSGRGELAVLTSVDGAGAPIPVSGSALICALYLNELVVRLTPRHDPHPPLFADYAQALHRLTSDDSQAWSLRRFERDLLAHIGYGLVLDVDAASGEPLDAAGDYVYRYEQGPIRWRQGMPELPVSGAALLALAHDKMPDPGAMNALRRMMRTAIAAHLDGEGLHAWTMLGGLRGN